MKKKPNRLTFIFDELGDQNGETPDLAPLYPAGVPGHNLCALFDAKTLKMLSYLRGHPRADIEAYQAKWKLLGIETIAWGPGIARVGERLDQFHERKRKEYARKHAIDGPDQPIV
jgi:hypothetical protein